MREIRTSGLMSGMGNGLALPVSTAPILDSTRRFRLRFYAYVALQLRLPAAKVGSQALWDLTVFRAAKPGSFSCNPLATGHA